MQIAVADAGRLDLDEHFAGTGRVELGGFNRQRLSLLPENGGVATSSTPEDRDAQPLVGCARGASPSSRLSSVTSVLLAASSTLGVSYSARRSTTAKG